MFASLRRLLKLLAIAAAVVSLPIFGLVAFSCFKDWRQEKFNDRFSHLGEKLEHCRQVVNAAQDRSATHDKHTKLAGKPILLCVASNNNATWPLRRVEGLIDPLMASLPEGLVPASGDEVRFAVSLRWGEELVGQYTDGSTALKETCWVDIFDMDSGERVISQNFVGGDPPTRKRENSNRGSIQKVFGNGCTTDIVKYLGAIFDAV